VSQTVVCMDELVHGSTVTLTTEYIHEYIF
jgi:hypothetical protein